MRKVLDVIWGGWEQKYLSENQKYDSTQPESKTESFQQRTQSCRCLLLDFQQLFERGPIAQAQAPHFGNGDGARSGPSVARPR
jgi:hypothetical protein